MYKVTYRNTAGSTSTRYTKTVDYSIDKLVGDTGDICNSNDIIDIEKIQK